MEGCSYLAHVHHNTSSFERVQLDIRFKVQEAAPDRLNYNMSDTSLSNATGPCMKKNEMSIVMMGHLSYNSGENARENVIQFAQLFRVSLLSLPCKFTYKVRIWSYYIKSIQDSPKTLGTCR